MSEHEELISRLEKAEAGSRLMDCAITDALGGKVWGRPHPRTRRHQWMTEIDGNAVPIPAVTTSLDAALALVERVLPRWGVDLGSPCRLGEHGGRPWASVWPPNEDGSPPETSHLWGRCNPANASALPLALCIALLRAHREGEGGKHG